MDKQNKCNGPECEPKTPTLKVGDIFRANKGKRYTITKNEQGQLIAVLIKE